MARARTGSSSISWLVFGAAGMASFRALALLDAHPEEQQAARAEPHSCDLSSPAVLPSLRACVLEFLRLRPTTPAILRDTSIETDWCNGTLPAGSAVLIYAPYFHRNDRFVPQADRFIPDLWLEPSPDDGPLLIPFSAGPAVCPGLHLVLLVTSTPLAQLSKTAEFRKVPPGELSGSQPLPGTLRPFGLRFECG